MMKPKHYGVGVAAALVFTATAAFAVAPDEIALGGQVVMRLRVASGGLSAAQRADRVRERLVEILSIQNLQAADVVVKPLAAGPTIFVRDKQLVTIDAATAKASQTTPSALAQAWAKKLAVVLPTVNAKTPPAVVAQAKNEPTTKPATDPATAVGEPCGCNDNPLPDEPKSASAQKDKIMVTPSGLKYEDLVEGTGESPKPGQTVTVHYVGTLENGTKFDASTDRGQPFSFQIGVGQVIRGWDEGVMTMKVGGKRKLTIPSELGYGARGAGGVIPPNATLIFDVELLGVQ